MLKQSLLFDDLPKQNYIIKFEDRAWEEAEYPRLVAKQSIKKTAKGVFRIENNHLLIECEFDNKEYKRERIFNSEKHLKRYLEIKFEERASTNFFSILSEGDIHFDIVYHYGRKKIALTITRTFLKNIFCFGEIMFFENFTNLEQFLSKQYNCIIEFPKSALIKLNIVRDKKIG